MIRLLSSLAFAALLAISAAPSQAEMMAMPLTKAPPPAVGDMLRTEIVLQDTKGNRAVRIKDYAGKNGLVIFFVRSADWCPYCKAQLKDANKYLETFKRARYGVVSVSYDTPQVLQKFKTEAGIAYPMLSDLGARFIALNGLLDENQTPGSRTYGIPNPTVLVLDGNMKVTAVLSEEGYKTRPPIADILATLRPSQ